MRSENPYRIIRPTALAGGIVVAIQTGISWATGSAVCPSEGCRLVERLTSVPPLVLNLMGLVFFLVVFFLARRQKGDIRDGAGLLGLVLVSGLAFEAGLFAYQVFVARAFCSYCLILLGLVVAMNLFYGMRQWIAGGAVFAAVVLSFSMLTFLPVGAGGRTPSLKTASYASKACSDPTKEVYLIFSSNCPHCQNVIDTLSECNSCYLYLNPIDETVNLSLAGLEANPGFSPQINRFVLNSLGIETVPVLLAKDAHGYRVIRGEDRILAFVRQACFTQNQVLYYDQIGRLPDQDISVITDDGGECSVAIDCHDEKDAPDMLSR
jgi:uncharacterized membrane protein